MNPLRSLDLRGAAGEAKVYAHGAHVTSFCPTGLAPVLFLSQASKFAAGEAIRGGVPVIFPWFGDDPDGKGRPAHGFARRCAWQQVDDGGDPARAAFALHDDATTRSQWPHRFGLRLEVEVGAALSLSLRVENRGAQAFRCEPALHTYLAVGDVRQVALHGLEGVRYKDKVAGMAERTHGHAPMTFVGETDRVFLGTEATCRVDDPLLARTLEVSKRGSRSTIVWNPWNAKAARMADLGVDAWPQFLCVESGNVADDALVLGPGESHVMAVQIAVHARA